MLTPVPDMDYAECPDDGLFQLSGKLDVYRYGLLWNIAKAARDFMPLT